MKYFFAIANQTNLRAVVQIIKEEKLPHQDCIIAYTRIDATKMTGIPSDIRLVDYSKLQLSLSSMDILSLIIAKKKIQNFYKEISNITKHEPFEFFIPLFWGAKEYLIVNHPLCQHFSYVEEGSAAFYPTNTALYYGSTFFYRKSVSPFLYLFFRELPVRFCRIPLQNDNYIPRKVYCITPHSFLSLPNRVILNNPFLAPLNWDYSYRHVFVQECWQTFFDNEEMYFDGIERFLKSFSEAGNCKICTKLHPSFINDKEFVHRFTALAKKFSLELKILPPEFILEDLMSPSSSDNKIFFYSINSSLLYYAALLCNSGCCILKYFHGGKQLSEGQKELFSRFKKYFIDDSKIWA